MCPLLPGLSSLFAFNVFSAPRDCTIEYPAMKRNRTFPEKEESKGMRGIKSGCREGSNMCFWSPAVIGELVHSSLWAGWQKSDGFEMQGEYEWTHRPPSQLLPMRWTVNGYRGKRDRFRGPGTVVVFKDILAYSNYSKGSINLLNYFKCIFHSGKYVCITG